MTDKTLPWIMIAGLLGIGGFSGGSVLDVTGAKAWQEEQAGKIAEAAQCQLQVQALQAQQVILLELVGRDR